MFNEGDTQQSSTDKPVALEFPIELEFRNVDFLSREENRRTRRKTLRARARTNNKLNPHMTPGNRTRDTLVVGGRSHHIATPVPLSFINWYKAVPQEKVLLAGWDGAISLQNMRYSSEVSGCRFALTFL